MKKIAFHRSILDSLPLPPPGQRAEYQDAAAPELVLRVTATGNKTFNLRRKINGKAVRVTLGTYKRPGDKDPVMTVEQARKLVRAPLRMWRREKAERAALAAVTVADDGITTA